MVKLFRVFVNIVCLVALQKGSRKVLMKKKWGDNSMKKFYTEMWGSMFLGRTCENSEGLFMCDDPIEIVECIWVNIWCIFD